MLEYCLEQSSLRSTCNIPQNQRKFFILSLFFESFTAKSLSGALCTIDIPRSNPALGSQIYGLNHKIHPYTLQLVIVSVLFVQRFLHACVAKRMFGSKNFNGFNLSNFYMGLACSEFLISTRKIIYLLLLEI